MAKGTTVLGEAGDILRALVREARNINVDMPIPANGGKIHALRSLGERAAALLGEE